LKIVIDKIIEQVKPVYLGSTFYTFTIWDHVSRVSQFAKDFAKKMGGDQFIAEAGGLLHDFGAAKYGQKDHHITGAQEAVLVLLECGCPLNLIGPIEICIYSHRGSERIPFTIPEAKCIAAADALDHFKNLEELWRVQVVDLKNPEMNVYHELAEKLKRDWEKTDDEIKAFLDGTHEQAQEELLRIASLDHNSIGILSTGLLVSAEYTWPEIFTRTGPEVGWASLSS